MGLLTVLGFLALLGVVAIPRVVAYVVGGVIGAAVLAFSIFALF